MLTTHKQAPGMFRRFIARIKSAFMNMFMTNRAVQGREYLKGPLDMLFGQVLLKGNVITDDQLHEALRQQKESCEQAKKSIKIGELIVELGYTTEEKILRTINKHYGIEAGNLSDNINSTIKKKRVAWYGGETSLYPSIRTQLSIAIILLLAISISSLGFFELKRQKANLYQQTVKIGKVSLNYFVSNAKIPLIKEDILRLNMLINEATSVEGVLYAFIVGNDKIIKAHTDFNRLETKYRPIDKAKVEVREEEITYFNYTLASGAEVLNISSPVMFQDTRVGEVHVGLSLDFIGEQIRNERNFIIQLSLLMGLLAIGVAVFLGMTFSRPILELVKATREIGKGNFSYSIETDRGDEFGDLARAFNFMAHELNIKALMQDTFGRYVSPKILDMILANPEETWLRGTRNEVTILFADIRGFTAYSEKREPEDVVEALNESFTIATEAILAYGGYVDKFIGDAVLGVFGVPVSSEKHVERAVRASLLMQDWLREAGAKGGNELLTKIGIGINTGVVVSGNIGSDVKMEYSIIGDSVNLASRINSLAMGGEVIISENSYEAVLDLVTAEKMPPKKVKGKTKPIVTYRVTSINDEYRLPADEGEN